jgi:hypothetical protein
VPKIFPGHPFREGGIRVDDGEWRAFAIAPESEFDQLLVNGHLLAAGRVLPLSANSVEVKYVRGSRDTGQGQSQDFNWGGVLDVEAAVWQGGLIAFSCNDQIVNPGPRPSRHYQFRKRAIAGSSSAPNVITVPFAGRRHARYLITPVADASGVDTISYCVYGRVWATPESAPPAGSVGQPAYAVPGAGGIDFTMHELVGGGTPSAPLVSGDYTNIFTTAFPVGAGTGNGKHVGGTNDAEYFDELVLFYWATSTAAARDAIIDVEVAGEEGCA